MLRRNADLIPIGATVFDCLRPLRGKGPSSFAITPGPLATPCWLWLGCLNSKGYPVRGTKDERYLVHRRVCESAHRPLADGEQAHHRCEVRRCVNPAHLEALGHLAHIREHRNHATIAEQAAALLAAGGPMSAHAIAGELGAKPASVYIALVRAAGRGEIVRVAYGVWACSPLESLEVAA